MLCEQPLLDQIQRLIHREIESQIDCALRSPTQQPPCPPRPSAIFALPPFVDLVLPEQHDHTRKQPHRLVLEDWLRDRFLTAELVRQCLKLF
jgi:hypothetical protein